jgi:MinD-like ATPase involved in chromosome partitioning or flagellar assembly
MHVATFYSFKGGVGRTMALTNIGVQLAKSGRRVLLVDFDLEAPGLDTLDLPKPKNPPSGIVEYVSEYLATHRAPDAGEYVYEASGIGEAGGALWIMPSGRADDGYAQKLASIDWQALYSTHGGYLLIEDLKLQWQQIIAPDYVLIDSRTGHTDVGGICTRQLPDAVVLFFFPNEQNLRGLRKVVDDIRAEARSPRRKNIQLHFVMSNVPDIDDENEILKSWMEDFRKRLRYDDWPNVIYRYDSLDLINQTIFTKDRPKSRLAQEYVGLMHKIIEHNPKDREGALSFLKNLSDGASRNRLLLPTENVESRLESIRNAHSRDSEIILNLARLRRQEGRFEEALILFEEAVQLGIRDRGVLLERAECRLLAADKASIWTDIQEVLDDVDVPAFHTVHAMRLLRKAEPSKLMETLHTPAVQSLNPDERISVARDLQWNLLAVQSVSPLLSSVLQYEQELSQEARKRANDLVILSLIALGDFISAKQRIADDRASVMGLSFLDAFLYAMAEWGETGVASEDLFARVATGQSEVDRESPANEHQVLAIALCVTGDRESAKEHISRARQKLIDRPMSLFSYWRFLMVTHSQFFVDLDAIQQMADGERITPLVFQEHRMSPSEAGSKIQ